MITHFVSHNLYKSILALMLIAGLLSFRLGDRSVVLKNLQLGFYKSSIEFVEFKLNEQFSSSRFDYTATIEQSYTANIYLTTQLGEGSNEAITINGVQAEPGVPFKQALKIGENIINIKVLNSKGQFNTYQLKIERADLSGIYTSEMIGPGVWRISDFGGFVGNENMYLFEGTDKAILFDTGMGKGDLPSFLKTLTSLPIEVAITHGHGDHYKQVDEFKENTVYMSQKDSLPGGLVTDKFHWVKEGDIIDIGNRKFEVIELPGHTMGSLLYFDSQNKMVITGDAVGSGSMVWMFFPHSSLTTYRKELEKIEDKIEGFDGLTLLVGHHYQEKIPLTGTTGKQYFTDMRIVTNKVLKGELVGKLAFRVSQDGTIEMRQSYYGLAGLWYNPKDNGIVGQ